jgi:hypothetical protein
MLYMSDLPRRTYPLSLAAVLLSCDEVGILDAFADGCNERRPLSDDTAFVAYDVKRQGAGADRRVSTGCQMS